MSITTLAVSKYLATKCAVCMTVMVCFDKMLVGLSRKWMGKEGIGVDAMAELGPYFLGAKYTRNIQSIALLL
jgi:hypothetical protein